MIVLTKEQIDAVRSNPDLGSAVAASLGDASLAGRPADMLTASEWDCLHDACLDVLSNEAPDVESFDAEQSKGVYTVCIRGVPGAYFVTAIEFDNSEVFSSLDEARNHADTEHGEFRVSEAKDDPEEEKWDEPDPFEPAFPEKLLSALGGTVDGAAIKILRDRIISNMSLVLLANGAHSPDDIPQNESVDALVSAFAKSLPKPSGYVEGMARGMSKLPRLARRVELFLRLNGRLPDQALTAILYNVE